MARKTTKTGRKPYEKHDDHGHPMTKLDRGRCRRYMEKHGEPWNGDLSLIETRMSKGQKAAATRKKNAALKKRAEVVDALLEETDRRDAALEEAAIADAITKAAQDLSAGVPMRDSRGRFTKETLEAWTALLESIEGAHAYLIENEAELVGAELRLSLLGQHLIAEFDGVEWTVTAE